MEKYLERLFIIEGIIFGILGFLFFMNPLGSLLALTNFSGWMFIILGVVGMFKKPRDIFMGIINILFGIILIFSPVSSIDIFISFYGVWSIIRGIYLFIIYIKEKTFGLNMQTLYSIALIILGIVILANPIISFMSVPYVIGVYFIVSAIFEIYLGFNIKSE
ncbi:hypothetical protein CHL78_002390 [Romboutsia weinsteinii]|uniref:DUF308 domain-containing protein n=1 Tax=Romboutsia weinsteinii TaxID=2020949 RepID=A0A371J926_9FIRM|nr:DUF308 domain-containing protein [Romboutsia weinsteinii]RDY29176.1 hypothetical protein CHL78_002390 [Romboutsia weinsteinii]